VRIPFCCAAILAALSLVPIAQAEVDEISEDAGFVVAGSRLSNGTGLVRIRADNDNNDTYEKLAASFQPYGSANVGDGVRVAAGDFDGDGNEELVTAAGRGLPVLIFDLNPDGSVGGLRESRKIFSSRGVFVAAGDLDGDGRWELVTSADRGGGPVVRIWSDLDFDMKVFDNQVDSFNAYNSSFRGGVRVAVHNVNNVGGDEVVTAPGPPGRQVRIWTDGDSDRAVSDQPLADQFSVYSSSFDGGLFVAAGQIDSVGGGGAEVIVAPGADPGPARKVTIRTDTDADGDVSDNPPAESFFAYGSSWKKGIRVFAGDTDLSGTFVEVLTAPGTAAGSKPVKIYDDNGDVGVLVSDNPLDDSFVSMPGSVNAGAYVTFARVRNATYARIGSPEGIADAATLVSEIVVPPSGGIIRDLDVSLNIAHTFDGDLDVTLVHVPTGIGVELFTDVGGTDEGFIIRLNDEAGIDIGTADNPADGAITGQFNPEGAALLDVFDGTDASGLWRLFVTDDAGGDSGTLMSWSLNVTY
jgi:subtilisin-like proprotein convertase family protein